MSTTDPLGRQLHRLPRPDGRESRAPDQAQHPAARLTAELQQHLGSRGLTELVRGRRTDPFSLHLLDLLDQARAGREVVELLPWRGSMEWTRQQVSPSPGARVEPTSEEVLSEFSDLLGVDLRDTRVQTSGAAAQGARALARRSGPRDEAVFSDRLVDRETVAHELAHVAQRRLAGARELHPLSLADSPAEREADQAAGQLARGRPFRVSQPVDAAVMRQALPETDAIQVWLALNSVSGPDADAALTALERGGPATREAYRQIYGARLEQDFQRELGGTPQAMQALAFMWPFMSVGDRVEGCLGLDDDEGGIVSVFRTASDDELVAYRSDPRRAQQLGQLSGDELLEARNRLYPELRVQNTGARIQEADGWLSDDEDGAIAALLRLDLQERQQLWVRFREELEEVLDDEQLALVRRVCQGVEDPEAIAALRGATESRSPETWEEALELVAEVAGGPWVHTDRLVSVLVGLPASWRRRICSEAPPELWMIYRARCSPAWMPLVNRLLQTGVLDFDLGLEAALVGAGVDQALLVAVCDSLEPTRRATVRKGYLAAHQGSDSDPALQAWRSIEVQLSELSSKDRDTAITHLLGGPAVAELTGPGGGRDAIELMRLRQEQRLALGGGLVDLVTTTDDALELAHVQFLALYRQVPERGEVPFELLAGLVALDQQFDEAFEGYSRTVDRVADLAGVLAATAVVVVATLLLGPAAVGAAPTLLQVLGANGVRIAVGGLAAAGASEAAGGELRDGSDAARMALVGSVEAAATVAGAVLAERFVETLGLSGPALEAALVRSAAEGCSTGLASVGRAASAASIEGAIDGAIGGMAGEVVVTLTDLEAWQGGIRGVISQIGSALLQGGLMGAGAGAVLGGGIGGARGALQARAVSDTGVRLDESLGSDARVTFREGEGGILGEFGLVYGPDISDADLAIHLDALRRIRRHGDVRNVLSRRLAGVDDVAPGTVAFQAREELHKLQGLIDQRLERLASEEPSPEALETSLRELDVFEHNAEVWLTRVDDLSPGSGQVGQTTTPEGFPDPPEGHWYYRTPEGAWDVKRKRGFDGKARTLARTDDGSWHFPERERQVTRVVFEDGTTREEALEALLEPGEKGHERSFRLYLDMLERLGLGSREEVLAAMVAPGGRSQRAVRHALKEHFAPRVLDRMFEEGLSAEQSHARLLETVEGLNGADKGSLGEGWYRRFQEEYEGVEGYATHPELAGVDGGESRFPAFVRGSPAGDVKMTSERLSGRDVVQGRDVLEAARKRRKVRVGGESREINRVEYVFPDPRGFVGSEGVLEEWLREYEDILTVRVFVEGRPISVNNVQDLRELAGRLR